MEAVKIIFRLESEHRYKYAIIHWYGPTMGSVSPRSRWSTVCKFLASHICHHNQFAVCTVNAGNARKKAESVLFRLTSPCNLRIMNPLFCCMSGSKKKNLL